MSIHVLHENEKMNILYRFSVISNSRDEGRPRLEAGDWREDGVDDKGC